MGGGEKSAQAESFVFGMKGFRGALFASTALAAAPAFVALSLRVCPETLCLIAELSQHEAN